MNNMSVTRTLIAYFSQPKEKVGIFFAILAEIFASLFGGWDVFLTTLIICMIFDYISGLAVAAKGKSKKTVTGRLSSSACWDGLLKKGLTLMIVLVACRLDMIAEQLGCESLVNIRIVVIGFYIGTEALSLMENYLAIGGDRIPYVLKKALETLLDQGGDDNDVPNRGEEHGGSVDHRH
ncbi:toxin secretion/phage lysis holin [Pseudobutyrivibrio sp. OR37]|nr:toxin secretion/phage lysis holin [Pseudobutyrivibrio sp. OR37]